MTSSNDQNTCPACGATFHCSTSGKCWCYGISVPPKVQQKIEDAYEDCLCPECLKGFSVSGAEEG